MYTGIMNKSVYTLSMDMLVILPGKNIFSEFTAWVYSKKKRSWTFITDHSTEFPAIISHREVVEGYPTINKKYLHKAI